MAFKNLLHFNEANLATTFTDDGSTPVTWTSVNGARATTAQKKFGSASLELRRLSGGGATDDYVKGPIGALSGAWTLETWVRFNALPASSTFTIFDLRSPDDSKTALMLQYRSGIGVSAGLSSAGTTFDISGGQYEWPFSGLATATDIHFAIVHDTVTGHYYGYLDGVLKMDCTSASDLFATCTTLHIGADTGFAGINGWVDEFAYSDTCRYPSGTTFTPPTTEFSAGFAVTGSGGALGGGAALVAYEYGHVAAGGALGGGAAVIGGDTLYDYIGTGGALAAGSADILIDTTAPVGAVISASLPVMRAALVGVDQPLAVIDAQLPAFTADIRGGVQAIDAKIPALSAQITAFTGVIGTIDARLTLLTPAIVGSAPVVATISARIPALDAKIDSRLNVVGTISAAINSMRAQVRGYTGVIGSVSATLPKLSASLGSRIDVTGTITASLASMLVDIGGEIPSAQIGVFVLNTINMALSEYQQFPFNSFADFNGAYYAAGSGGIVALDDTASDEGAAIAAHTKSGLLDFGSEYMKHLENLYATMRANGQVTCKISMDEGTQYTYTLDPLAVGTLAPRRVKIGKGLRGKTMQFEYANVAGSNFEFDTLTVDVAIHPTRRL